ncbi:integrase [Mesorhizobium sp. M1A.T.Ca.IN.004.03.1.1]|uniref:tyrosine-type recombinase/integrase n=1 Tax=unclassified Mesorhizobium TaxID=325217 RepID=UPI000FC9D43E|nr:MULTISPECIES: tyrosine-type recombinase/integrase [unclassified Mesorhizobium]RUV40230.1 integrase [Mesorhizobium sp. M1A.T.Ca.IN.004.03.1.1]RWP53216.1 MAG: integrase [Mesorhizobium sp.]
MILRDAIDHYVAWRRAHGARFFTSANTLYQFCKSVPEHRRCDAVTESEVRRFLAGTGPLTRWRANKYAALAGFYRYAISRGYAALSPLPSADEEPRDPQSAPSYIYSREELERLFGAIDISRKRAIRLDADTFRTLLLILYGAGLRTSEALHLSMSDVDFADAVLTVRDTKFYKSRLVPVAPQLAGALSAYAERRSDRPLPQGMASAFLANRDGTQVRKHNVDHALKRLLETTGIDRKDDGRRAPCLHAFRHTAAVHRLTSWYRQGADVQRLLPALSTYLGHANLDDTSVYLSMTPELLHEASVCFDRYVNGGDHG